ncbi:hypothetical protein JK364_02580 [Streptomyces sp. 110]|uniref:Uncharacterized protein n=1 Tax=Streptomyces endocoffeicus TaxID=2898945 RepID=A0ABS1PFZ7_9ACTN|nr:hypothetical protein [Streptomyces endocoffeicus]MBL1111303.1 hypothetical protein [Streptomyces endocoffeicus]
MYATQSAISCGVELANGAMISGVAPICRMKAMYSSGPNRLSTVAPCFPSTWWVRSACGPMAPFQLKRLEEVPPGYRLIPIPDFLIFATMPGAGRLCLESHIP